MSFKINKSAKFKIEIQPKNNAGQTQLTLEQTAFMSQQNGPDVTRLIDSLAKEDSQSSDLISALTNRHVSKAFEDLYRRGVNPLRAEVLFVNELVAISSGESDEENADTASINLNYGEGSNLKVNQVMRLIDLQRIIRKSILKKSGDFLEDYINVSNGDQEKIIKHMHKVLKRNIEKFLELGNDTERMVSLLIDISSKTESHGSNGNSAESTSASMIKSINESEKAVYIRSITRYVLLDYVAQNSISLITRIYDLKDLLKEAISIANTELPKPELHTVVRRVLAPPFNENTSTETSNTNSNSAVTVVAVAGMVNPEIETAYEAAQRQSGTITEGMRIRSANKLLGRWGMPSTEGPDGFSSDSRHSLASVINANVTSEKTEELFGSNKHMYTNLFANLLKNMTFMQTVDSRAPKEVNKGKIAFTSGQKNLAKGLKILKSINPQSMTSENFVLNSGTAGSLNGGKLDAMLSAVSGDKDTALVELVAAVCYDQTAGSNSLGGLSKIMANTFDNFEGLASIDDIIVEYFNKVFFNTGKATWSDLASDQVSSFDYSNIASNNNMLGAYLKSRFLPVIDEGVTYVPNEHTYEDNVHSDASFLNSPDYFFNKAIESEELKFDKMIAESKSVLRDIDTIVHDISLMLGLDFDTNGDPDVSHINGFTDDQNPLSYFYTMCDVLGKEIRRTANDLGESADLAVPLIHAGKLDDLNFTADVIKGSFFSGLANKTNGHLILNLNEDADGNLIDKNIVKKQSATEESMCMFAAETLYYVEDRIWYRLFRGPLSAILKDKSPDSVNSKMTNYGADKSKEYNAIIANGLAGGLASFNETKVDKSATFEGYTFGDNRRIDNEHDDFHEETISGDTDQKFGEKINIDSGVNGWELVLVMALATIVIISGAGFIVAVATGFGTTFLGVGAISAGGAIMNVSLLSILGGTIFSAVGVASLVTSAVITAGTWVALSSSSTPEPDGRPAGVGFSKSGLFETALLTNAALVPPSLRPKTAEDAENEVLVGKIMTNLFGSQGKENFMLKAKPGNGDFKEWSLEGLIDSFAEFLQGIVSWWFGTDGDENEGTMSEEDMYKPYYFNCNKSAGEYGGIFKTNTASRYTIFTLFFARVMYKSLSARYGGQSGKFIIKHYPTCWIGMADALERKSKNADFDTNGKYAKLKGVYDQAYDSTARMMQSVKSSMMWRRAAILKNLSYLKQNSSEIREAVSRAEKIFSGTSIDIPAGEKIALQYLRKVGFAKTGFTFLNSNTSGTLLRNYQKKYMLDFRSDVDESANPEGISVYPYFKLESYDIRELKIMAKLFSEKGRGLTSSIDDSLGRKTIMHIGIPIGMLRALQNEAYSKTSDIAYYYSNNIAIHITKKNDLDQKIKYQSRTYVFNMSKYIASIKSSESYSDIKKPGEFSLGNHLEKYDDNWTIEAIKENIEILTSSRLSPLYEKGIKGITKIDKSETIESEYNSEVYEAMLENHIYDHYSKMYTQSTTGIDISETSFPIDRAMLFDGTVDDASVAAYNDVSEELVRIFPASNTIPSVAQEYYRVMKSLRSALHFSSESRYKSVVSTQCFQRVFSIPISERDFVLKQSAYNMNATDIYKAENIPKLVLTNKKVLSLNKIIPVTGIDESYDNYSASEMFAASPSKIVLEYQKGLNSNKTDVSSFIIEVAILKSSNLS